MPIFFPSNVSPGFQHWQRLHRDAAVAPAPGSQRGPAFWQGVWAASHAHGNPTRDIVLVHRQPAAPSDKVNPDIAPDTNPPLKAEPQSPAQRPPTNPSFRPGFNLPARLDTLDELKKRFIGCKERKQFDWNELRSATVAPTLPVVTNEAARMFGNHAARIATAVVGVGISRLTGLPVITGWNPLPVEGQRLPTGPLERNLPSILTSLIGFTAFNGVSGAVRNAIDQIRYLRRDDRARPLLAAKYMHDDIVSSTKKDVAALPAPIRAQVERIDTQIRRLTAHAGGRPAGAGRGGEPPSVDPSALGQVYGLLDRREAILCSDLQPKHPASIVATPETERALNAIADAYPEGPRKGLKDFFKRIKTQPRAAAFFYGNSGTGKTTTTDAIAKALDWPLLNYTLPEFLDRNFFGPKRDWTLERPDEPLEDVAGLFFVDLLRVGRNDVVVAINEANFGEDPRAPHVQELKVRMEKKVLEFVNNGIPREFRAIFIFNGNFPNDKIQPLRERIPQIDFYFEEPQKRKKAIEVLEHALQKGRHDLPSAQHAKLEALCRENLDFIVKCDVAMGDGLRVIEEIVQNMHTRLQDDVRDGRVPTPWRMKQDIVDDFRRNVSADERVFQELMDEECPSTPKVRSPRAQAEPNPFAL